MSKTNPVPLKLLPLFAFQAVHSNGYSSLGKPFCISLAINLNPARSNNSLNLASVRVTELSVSSNISSKGNVFLDNHSTIFNQC